MSQKTFRLPDLGEGLTESEIVTWRVAEGDAVSVNQVLADVETAKAVVEVSSPFAGVVAALHGVGAACLAVDDVVSGQVSNAFVAARPPGHHAERATAMGFCLFNQAAIAARHAQEALGLSHIAIIDWDVHHGNGTQDIFWSDPTVLYASLHQMPLYPGTGAASERGLGNILNVPLPPGAKGDEFRTAWSELILPAVERFSPGLILVSAGFDAHARDPLAHLRLTEADFTWVTSEICAAARRVCGGRVVSMLEGGYDLDALARSVAAHVRALMDA